MPNRIIKESITTSCEIDQLSAEEERLFYRLIVVCDDYGRLDGRPQIIRAKCFPLKLDNIKDKQIQQWIDSLISAGLLIRYEVDNKPFLQMATWEKHQQKRAKYSKYPSVDDGVITHDIKCNHMQENASRESRNEKREYENAHSMFEELWQQYPRKKGKGRVSNTQKQEICKVGKEHMERAIARFNKDMEKEGRPIDKYMYGSTFFNSGYIDYLDGNYTEDAGGESKWQMA